MNINSKWDENGMPIDKPICDICGIRHQFMGRISKQFVSAWDFHPIWIKIMGNYNAMPEPWYEIDENVAKNDIFNHFPIATELKQVRGFNNFIKSINIFYYDDHALGIMPKYLQGNTYNYRFFYIGCKHEYVYSYVDRLTSKALCNKCSYSYEFPEGD